MSKEIMQQALDALSICLYFGEGNSDNDQSYLPPRVRDKTRSAIAALEAELAKPEPVVEPANSATNFVESKHFAQPEQEPVAWITRRTGDGGVVISGYETCEPTDYDAIPVYTAPTKREWQALAQPEQEPEQEPVAWIGHSGNLAYSKNNFMPSVRHLSKPLYTAPPSKPWVSLTDDEIPTFDYATPQFLAEKKFARAIEAKLKEKNT